MKVQKVKGVNSLLSGVFYFNQYIIIDISITYIYYNILYYPNYVGT